jgi:hypothetical protein
MSVSLTNLNGETLRPETLKLRKRLFNEKQYFGHKIYGCHPVRPG